jgi:chemotaxis protein MotB
MNRKRRSNKVNKDAWLNTYADMITLILVFFILLYSMSTIDQEKYRMLVEAFTADPATLEQIKQMNTDHENQGGSSDSEEQNDGQDAQSESEKIDNLDKLYEYLKNYVSENNLQNSVQIEKGKNLVYVRFMSSLFFEADRAVLRSGGTEILDYVGKALGEVEPYIKFIRIDGHTAEAAPGTSTVDNRGLSTDRANEVLRYLETRYIHEPSKMMAVGYGYYRPVAPNDSEENRAKNRRVEILIAQQDTLQDELDKIYSLDYGTSSGQDNE